MNRGAPAATGLRANPRSDLAVKAAAAAHGLLLIGVGAALAGPLPIAARVAAVMLLGLAMCWGANTVSHIHLHTPLFRWRTGNQLTSIYLTALLAIPQSHWRRRHLRHHGLVDPANPARRWPQRPRSPYWPRCCWRWAAGGPIFC